MWWNDIKEIKDWMDRLTDRLIRIEDDIKNVKVTTENLNPFLESIYESQDEISDRISSLRQSINHEPLIISNQAHIIKISDLIYTSEKNLKALSVMMLEFKGCVSMARGSLDTRKEMEADFAEMKKVANISQDIYKGMISFVNSAELLGNQNYKIDAIFNKVTQEESKKKLVRKSLKKVNVSESVY